MNLFEVYAKIRLDTNEYKKAVESSKKTMKEAEKGMQDAQKQSDVLKNKLSFLTKQYEQATRNVAELSKKFSESQQKTGALSRETEELAKQLDSAEKEAKDLKSALDQYTNITSNAAKKTDEDTKFMGKSWNAWGVTIVGIITGAVAAAASAVVSLTKTGLQFNSEIESYTTNFEVLLGDAGLAAEKVEQLKDMAAKTPFGIGDLSQATQTLLGFGIEAEKTEDILTMLGDAALGDKNRLQSLSLAFAQATSAGKLMGQDLMQMINAGFNPLNSLAQMTGLSVGQLKEIMSGTSEEALETMLAMEGVTDYGRQIIEQGEISADDLYNALHAATSEGGLFFNGMEKSSQTLSGLISTLTDDFNALMGTAASPLFKWLKSDVLPGVGELVQSISDLLEGEGSADAVAEIGTNLILGIMVGIAKGASELVDPLVKAIDSIVDNIPINKLATSGGKLIGSLVNAAAKLIRGGASILYQLAPDLIAAIPIFIEGLLSSIDLGNFVKTITLFNIDLLVMVLPELFDVVAQVVPELIFVILNELGKSAPSIVTAIANILWSLISGVTRLVIEVVKEIVPLVGNTVISALTGVVSLVSGVVEGLINNIAKLPDTITNVFNGNMTVSDAMNSWSDWWGGALDTARLESEEWGRWATSTKNRLTFDFDGDLTKPVENGGGGGAGYRGGRVGNIENVDVQINIGGTNATPEEISDAVTEAISVALAEFSYRKEAAYGKTPIMAR